jgi:hypothetical protein
MEVHFTPERESRFALIATREGIDPQELVKDAALKLLEDDAQFEDGEMDARVKRMLRP